jgi:hypothetical protein
LHQREFPLIGHNNWHKKECDLLDPKGVFLARGRIMAFDLREEILDNIFRNDHVSLTILYYLKNILAIMTIWKWSLV